MKVYTSTVIASIALPLPVVLGAQDPSPTQAEQTAPWELKDAGDPGYLPPDEQDSEYNPWIDAPDGVDENGDLIGAPLHSRPMRGYVIPENEGSFVAAANGSAMDQSYMAFGDCFWGQYTGDVETHTSGGVLLKAAYGESRFEKWGSSLVEEDGIVVTINSAYWEVSEYRSDLIFEAQEETRFKWYSDGGLLFPSPVDEDGVWDENPDWEPDCPDDIASRIESSARVSGARAWCGGQGHAVVREGLYPFKNNEADLSCSNDVVGMTVILARFDSLDVPIRGKARANAEVDALAFSHITSDDVAASISLAQAGGLEVDGQTKDLGLYLLQEVASQGATAIQVSGSVSLSMAGPSGTISASSPSQAAVQESDGDGSLANPLHITSFDIVPSSELVGENAVLLVCKTRAVISSGMRTDYWGFPIGGDERGFRHGGYVSTSGEIFLSAHGPITGGGS